MISTLLRVMSNLLMLVFSIPEYYMSTAIPGNLQGTLLSRLLTAVLPDNYSYNNYPQLFYLVQFRF